MRVYLSCRLKCVSASEIKKNVCTLSRSSPNAARRDNEWKYRVGNTVSVSLSTPSLFSDISFMDTEEIWYHVLTLEQNQQYFLLGTSSGSLYQSFRYDVRFNSGHWSYILTTHCTRRRRFSFNLLRGSMNVAYQLILGPSNTHIERVLDRCSLFTWSKCNMN